LVSKYLLKNEYPGLGRKLMRCSSYAIPEAIYWKKAD